MLCSFKQFLFTKVDGKWTLEKATLVESMKFIDKLKLSLVVLIFDIFVRPAKVALRVVHCERGRMKTNLVEFNH